MSDLIIEVIRAVLSGFILVFIIRYRRAQNIGSIDGWGYIAAGFAFIFFGMGIDITDNFESLNKFIVIGDTVYQSFLEKVIGFLLGIFLISVGIYKWLPQVVSQIQQTKKALEEAENQVKVLSGLLPICASCKNIRDDNGYWNQIESYIEKHSDAQFSHGLCPECAKELYGGEEWFQKRTRKE